MQFQEERKEGVFSDGNNSLNKCGSRHGCFAFGAFSCLTLEFAVTLAFTNRKATEVKNVAVHEA